MKIIPQFLLLVIYVSTTEIQTKTNFVKFVVQKLHYQLLYLKLKKKVFNSEKYKQLSKQIKKQRLYLKLLLILLLLLALLLNLFRNK